MPVASAPSPPPAGHVAGGSLRSRMIRGSLWTVGGHGTSQVLRLGSNLIMTRLLFPEAFGIMALVNVVLQGLQMFSDVGIGPSIIQNKRGEDPAFLNTAWTIQVFRGIALWVVCCALAYPVSLFYENPLLGQLLPVAGLMAVVSGFNSPALFLANRKLELGRLTALDLATQGVSICVMVAWALIWPSVWALLAGGLVGGAAKMLGTHAWLVGPRCRLRWDRDAAKALVRFGRWIFLSTMFGFIVNSVDRVVLGKFMTSSQLGLYAIAFVLAQTVNSVAGSVNERVLFPAYASVHRRHPERLRSRIRSSRVYVLSAVLPLAWGLILFGPSIIRLLYDVRYANAGWMLQFLGIHVALRTTLGPISHSMLVFGDSRRLFLLTVSRSVLLLMAMCIGGALAGTPGILGGYALASLLNYPFTAAAARRHDVWLPVIDGVAVAGTLAAGAVAFALS